MKKPKITTKRLAAILWWFEGSGSDPVAALRALSDYVEAPLEHIAQNFEEQTDRETRNRFMRLANGLRG